MRVTSAVLAFLGTVNAVLLGVGAYDGGAAAAVTGILVGLGVLANELFTRSEVVPIKPLEELAAAEANRAPPT